MRCRIEIIEALVKTEMIGKIEKQSEKGRFEIHPEKSAGGQVVRAKVGQEVKRIFFWVAADFSGYYRFW